MRKAPGAIGVTQLTRPDRGRCRTETRAEARRPPRLYRSRLWILQIVRGLGPLTTGTTVVPVVADRAAVLSPPSASPMTRDVGARRVHPLDPDGRQSQFRRLPVP